MAEEELAWVLIVDDYAPMRTLARRVLRDLVSLSEADSCEEALELLRAAPGRYEVVILDLSFPPEQLQGDEALAQIKQEWPDQVVVLLSVSPEEELAGRSHSYDYVSYVPKEHLPPDLLAARVVTGVELARALRRASTTDPASRGDPDTRATRPRPTPLPPPSLTCQPSSWPTGSRAAPVKTLNEVMREHVEQVLAGCGGNLTRAAAQLDIQYSKLRRLIAQLGISSRNTIAP